MFRLGSGVLQTECVRLGVECYRLSVLDLAGGVLQTECLDLAVECLSVRLGSGVLQTEGEWQWSVRLGRLGSGVLQTWQWSVTD